MITEIMPAFGVEQKPRHGAASRCIWVDKGMALPWRPCTLLFSGLFKNRP